MKTFSKLVLAFPKTILMVAVFSLVICSYLSSLIPFDFSTESLFVTDDPNRVVYQQFKEEFGNDDNFIFIAFHKENLFSPKILNRIKDLSDDLREVEKVEDSISIVDVIAVEDLMERFQDKVRQFRKQMAMFGQNQEEGSALIALAEQVGIKNVVKQIQEARRKANILEQPDRLGKIKQRVLKNPLYEKNIISKDGNTTGILLLIDESVRTNETRSRQLDRIQALLDEHNQDGEFDFHLAGMPVVRTTYARLISKDHLTFLPIILPIFGLVLFFIFKDYYQVLAPPLAVGTGVLWTVGLMSAMGESINIVSNVIYVLLLVIGVASSVHVVTCYNSELAHGKSKEDAIKYTIEVMGKACFFTSFTTSIGFLSLLVTDIAIIRQFGLYSAIGVMFTFIATVVLVPVALYFFPVPNIKEGERQVDHKLLKKNLIRISYINQKYCWYILTFILLCTALWGVSIYYLKIDTHMLEEIYPDNPVVIANKFVEKNLSGILPLEVLIREKKDGLFQQQKALEKIDKLEQYIGNQEIVSNVLSLTDLMKTANYYVHDQEKKYYHIPENPKLVAKIYELLDVVSRQERGSPRFTANDHSTIRISIRIVDAGSNAHFELVDRLENYVAKNFPKDQYQVIFTGETHMAAIVLKRLVGSMLSSIFLAAGIIFFVIMFLFRSLRIALMSLLPNLLPIIFTMGMMGLTGIILRTSTVVIFSISLGIAVDDSIHYLVKYREFKVNQGMSERRAMRRTLLTAGRAMVWTSLVLCSGLIVLITSNFVATVDFGIFTIVTILSALVGDILLLPVCMYILGRRKEKRAERERAAAGDVTGEVV